VMTPAVAKAAMPHERKIEVKTNVLNDGCTWAVPGAQDNPTRFGLRRSSVRVATRRPGRH